MSLNLCRYEAENISFKDLEKLKDNIYYEIKYDGTHICLKYENELKINTRKDIPHDKTFQNLFYQVPNIDEVTKYIKQNSQYIIHGELVHKKTSAQQIHTNEIPEFIIYDVFDKENNKYLKPSEVDSEIYTWYPEICLDLDDLLDIITKEKLEGLIAKIYNPKFANCEEGKNFNLCLYKYKPYFSTLGVIFKPIRREIDVRQLSFLLGEIDNDLKNNKDEWYRNHPELYKFFIENKDKIISILQNKNFELQIEKNTHINFYQVKKYIENFKR
jgi:ATP dependent DNA ligase domain.